jgi:hypothetical protein
MNRRALAAPLAIALAALAAAPALAHRDSAPTLEARAILAENATAPAPFPAVRDQDPAPAPGSTQPVGGFSALLQGPGDSYLAMPDNGFGAKANSRSFMLRVYWVKPRRETAKGGSGDVRILGNINLRDPNHKVPFAIVNEATKERYLTGGDFDVESFRIDRRGTLWFGEEFGPFLLHTDITGKVLEEPIPLPDVKSPQYPADYPAPYEGDPNLLPSNGFEGMAISTDGRTLYPTLEGPVAGDDTTVRRMYRFDISARRYEHGYRQYHVADPSYLVSDLSALDRHRFVALERDNFEGALAVHKQGFVVDRRTLAKRPVVDLLNLRDPAHISEPARAGDLGIGDPFSMPYVTIEAVLPLPGDQLAIVNDTNFGSHGRNPALNDYSDFIRVKVPGLR